MKTNLLATLTLAAALSPALSAQKVNTFPPFLTPQDREAAAQTKEGMMRAPLNPNAANGTYIFGATNQDYNRYTHLMGVWSENPSKLEKYQMVWSEGDSEYLTHAVQAGAWAGDKWYGYKARYYTFEVHPTAWISSDVTSGTFEVVTDLYKETGSQQITVADLAWNPVDEALYALDQSDHKNKYGFPTSKLVQVDPANGEILPETVFQFEDYYFCMAFNYDGLLYAIRWTYNSDGELMGAMLDIYENEDNEFFLNKSTPLTLDGKSFKIYYQNTLAFDYTTGDLWWGAVNKDQDQYLVMINPDNYTTTNKGKVGINEVFLGMHIPYRTADARTAPARVENLNFTIDPNGANKVTLSWTNPSKTWNRKNLSALKEVVIYRDNENGTPVATLDASGKVGAAMTWTDETAAQGVHTYYVVPCAKAGERGVAREIDAFVGRDVPGPVENLTATTDGKTITLNWKAPSRGDNDGWFDKTSMKYNIVRMPDNTDLGTITETTYTDSELPEAMEYSYVITPLNADGRGSSITSNGCIAGTSISVPFSTDFKTPQDGGRFTSLDKNYDGTKWEYGPNNHRGGTSMRILCSDYSNDDILVTPPMKLKKGMTYKVTYNYSIGGYGDLDRVYLQDIKFVGGLDCTIEGMTDEYEHLVDRAVEGRESVDEIVTYFTSPVDGTYYFGFELLTSDEKDWWMYMEGFSITEAPDTDLEAAGLKFVPALSNKKSNLFEVSVYNNGKSTNGNYKVQVAYMKDGNPMVFTTESDVPAVESHATATVKVKGYPKDLEGEYDIVAIVVGEGDGNPHNDMTAAQPAIFSESDPFNYSVGEKESDSSEAPFSYYYNAHATQTIYTPDMTGIKDVKDAKITRIAWEYTASESIENTEIEVFVEHTNRTGYLSGDTQWIVPTTKYRFMGPVSIMAGSHVLDVDFDTPLDFDANKPLIVTVNKFEALHAGDFPVMFNVFDNDWYLDEFHTLFARGKNDKLDVREPAAQILRSPVAPVIHLALIGEGSGVEEIVLSGNATYFFNSNTGVLHANNSNLRAVEVFDFSGRAIKHVNVAAGTNEVALNLPAGMYILRMTDANGNAATLKVKANR